MLPLRPLQGAYINIDHGTPCIEVCEYAPWQKHSKLSGLRDLIIPRPRGSYTRSEVPF